jgi:hypothetical protein
VKVFIALIVGAAFILGSCGATKQQVKEEQKVEEPKNGAEEKKEDDKRFKLEDYAKPDEEKKDEKESE